MERLAERIQRQDEEDLILFRSDKYKTGCLIPAEMTNDNIRTVLKKLAAYEDAEDKLEEMVEKLRNASFERYGNDGMGGEQVVNLDDAIEIVKEGV